MSQVQFIESARRAESRPMLDLRDQLTYLRDEWRLMLRPGTMAADALAGLGVALVALPLSLAISTASGVDPEVGLITAIVGGIVVALFGGSRLQVSGPAAAMTLLVYEIVSRYGMQGMVAATLMAALLQLLAGVLRLGRFIRLIPRPVIAGFLPGIGLTILCTQLPVVLGYEVSHTEEGGALSLLWETLRLLHQTAPTAMAVGLIAAVAMLGLPRISQRLPTPLIAVVVASVIPAALGWSRVALLGELPTRLPRPSLPEIPWGLWNELVLAALTIFLLASLESLLSASVVDSLAKGHRTDNDQELIGQGLGNLASALFGGIPVTGVIARSATNIQAGARTRLAAILHAMTLPAMMQERNGIESLDRTPMPRACAMIARDKSSTRWAEEPAREGFERGTLLGALTEESLWPGPPMLWNRLMARPPIAASAFVDARATVIGEVDEVVAEECLIDLGAVVIGVSLPAGRYVSHNVVDTQEQADSLPAVAADWERLRAEVVEVNQELAAGHREVLLQAAIGPLATSDCDVGCG